MSQELKTQIQKNAYNEFKEKAFKSHMSNSQADFYSRTLSYFWPELLMTKYANINFRDYVSIQSAPIYNIDVVFNIATLVGSANLKSNRAEDIDMVDTYISEMSSKVVQFNLGYKLDFVQRAAIEAMSSGIGQGPSSQIMRAKFTLCIVATALGQRKFCKIAFSKIRKSK